VGECSTWNIVLMPAEAGKVTRNGLGCSTWNNFSGSIGLDVEIHRGAVCGAKIGRQQYALETSSRISRWLGECSTWNSVMRQAGRWVNVPRGTLS